MSTLDRTTEYMVRNYTKSPVAISTRDTRYLIPGGTLEAPAEFPMTLNELTYVNSISDIFKIGILFFDEEHEAEIYDVLRIRDWANILHIDEIDDIILNPTTEKLERVIAIQNQMYFERVYGEYIALKNAGRPISGSVEQVMKLRKKEFQKGTIRSEIKVKVSEPTVAQIDAQNDKIAEMEAKIAQLTALLAQQNANTTEQDEEKPTTQSAKRGRKPAGDKADKEE